eukprot:403371422
MENRPNHFKNANLIKQLDKQGVNGSTKKQRQQKSMNQDQMTSLIQNHKNSVKINQVPGEEGSTNQSIYDFDRDKMQPNPLSDSSVQIKNIVIGDQNSKDIQAHLFVMNSDINKICKEIPNQLMKKLSSNSHLIHPPPQSRLKFDQSPSYFSIKIESSQLSGKTPDQNYYKSLNGFNLPLKSFKNYAKNNECEEINSFINSKAQSPLQMANNNEQTSNNDTKDINDIFFHKSSFSIKLKNQQQLQTPQNIQ